MSLIINKLSGELKRIAIKVQSKQRLSNEEGIYLYEHAPLSVVGVLANDLKEARYGNVVWFNRNFHVEPTNVCIYTCSFCSYSRLLKKREEGWEYTHDQIMDIVKSYDDQDVTEIHITGGVLPQYDLQFYTKLFKEIRSHRPALHIKALTPVEFHYIFKKGKVNYEEGLKILSDAGLDSIPGGGAEIFDEKVRNAIAGDKCSADEWMDIHKIWHTMGKKSNATMLYGHIESFEDRIDHMAKLRSMQDETKGFQTFIPLKYRNKDNQMSHLPELPPHEDLRNYAISRIFLDNFDHIKAYWPMIGRNMAQLSLSFGVDDMDGTIDDSTKIYSMAGSEEQSPAMSTEEIVNLIRTAGKKAVERDTLYNTVKDYTGVELENDKTYRGYVSLPVVKN
jgi:aminodeoxyfutalosine synthase